MAVGAAKEPLVSAAKQDNGLKLETHEISNSMKRHNSQEGILKKKKNSNLSQLWIFRKHYEPITTTKTLEVIQAIIESNMSVNKSAHCEIRFHIAVTVTQTNTQPTSGCLTSVNPIKYREASNQLFHT